MREHLRAILREEIEPLKEEHEKQRKELLAVIKILRLRLEELGDREGVEYAIAFLKEHHEF